MNRLKKPFTRDNFIELQDEVEELKDIILKLNSLLTISSLEKVGKKGSVKKG